jgi:uncharacterized protein YjeT (DUF2065 family)
MTVVQGLALMRWIGLQAFFAPNPAHRAIRHCALIAKPTVQKLRFLGTPRFWRKMLFGAMHVSPNQADVLNTLSVSNL